MIRQTVCKWCSYRFEYQTGHEVTYCPICGAAELTKDIVPIRSMEEEEA